MASLMQSKYPVGQQHTLPARSGVAVFVKKDQLIKVINTHGTQVVDFWTVKPDLTSHLSMSHTRAYNLRLSPVPGDILVDSLRNPMLTLVEDTTPSGIHDTLIASCDLERYRMLGVPEGTYHDNCADNYRNALKNDAGISISAAPPDPLNLFMNIPVHPVEAAKTAMSIQGNRASSDGVVNLTAGASLSFEVPVCSPGDWVKFKSLTDCIVVMSACPQDIVKINNNEPKDVHFVVEQTDNIPRLELLSINISANASDSNTIHPGVAFVRSTRFFRFGYLALLSILGSLLAIALLVASIALKDGFAMVATILLSLTSTIVGFASKCRLLTTITGPRQDREGTVPIRDLVISYPNGAFRIIRCPEEISRLYFASSEAFQPAVSSEMYLFLALIASVFLMIGLLCMGNSQTELQLAFAGSYILLNVCYWAISAVNPLRMWSHRYMIKHIEYGRPMESYPTLAAMTTVSGRRSTFRMPFSQQAKQEARETTMEQHTFVDAVWVVTALTRSTRWLKVHSILPDTEVWRTWIDMAEKRVRPRRNIQGRLVQVWTMTDGRITLPAWNYKEALRKLLQREQELKESRLQSPDTLNSFRWNGTQSQGDAHLTSGMKTRLREWATDARSRVQTGNILPFPGFPDPYRNQPQLKDRYG